MTRNFRTNKRGKHRRAAAFYLVPTMHRTAALPLVTTKNVTAKRKVLTTVMLKTRNIRVKAHFTLASRDSTDPLFGRCYLDLNRKSAGLLLGGLTPAHLIGGDFQRTMRGTRSDKTSVRRLETLLKQKHTGGNVFRKSLRRKRLRVKRMSSVVSHRRPITRIVGRLIRTYRQTTGGSCL